MNQTIRNLLLLFPRGGIKWLLRDEFSDTRAAGAVNGTPATPGPGTRVVTDTTNKLTIGGGLANLAPGTVPADGDPGLWYGAVARVAGRVLLFRANWAVRGWSGLGFDTNQAGAISELSFVSDNATLLRFYMNAVGYNWRPLLAATNYDLALVVGTVGGCFFIRAAGAWLLEWYDMVGNAATLYPGIQSNAATFTVDYIRIPDALWLPTQLAYDTFTRANGAIGVSEVTGPDGQAVTARTYTDQVGTWDISGNTAVATVLGIVILPTLHADVVLQATLTTPGAGVTPGGIIVRWLDANNYWYVRVTPGTAGNDFDLVEVNAGVPTVRGTADEDPAAATAYVITVITYGQTIDVFWNQFRRIHYTTAALNETQSIHGLRDEGNSNFVFDNLLVYPRGTGGEFSALNKWSS